MANFGSISDKGRYNEDFQDTFYVPNTVTSADVGKAVSLNGTTAHGVKLAADGDFIVGRLEVYEDRVQEGADLATVSRKGIALFPIKSGLTGVNVVAIGDTVVGAGGGEVRTYNLSSAKVPAPYINFVKQLVTIDSVAYALVVY